MQIQPRNHTCNNSWSLGHLHQVEHCTVWSNSCSLRIQVFVLPNARRQLPDNSGVQDQVVDEALITCSTTKRVNLSVRVCSGSICYLLTPSHSSDSGEMSSMRDRKFCKNCVLLSESCRRLQYSLRRQKHTWVLFFHRGVRSVKTMRWSPWSQKHMSWWFKGAGQQRLHI